MMKYAVNIILLSIAILLVSCESENSPHVYVKSKEIGSTEQGTYVEATIRNDGSLPAYFVILHISIELNGKEMASRDFEFGDIFPNGEVTESIEFKGLTYRPDFELKLSLTYTKPYAGNKVL